VAVVCLFLDGCHCCFHRHYGVESESQTVKLLYLLQECGVKILFMYIRKWREFEMTLATMSDPKLSVVFSLHCRLVWFQTHYFYFVSIELHSGFFASGLTYYHHLEFVGIG